MPDHSLASLGDRLATVLSTRRGAVRFLGASLALGMVRVPDASAKKRKKKKKKKTSPPTCAAGEITCPSGSIASCCPADLICCNTSRLGCCSPP